MLANMMLISAEGNNWVLTVVLLVIMIVLLFILPMVSNKRRQKEANDIFDGISVGDEIMTIGGIMGKVVALTTHESGEKLMVIETGEGASKTTMTFTVQACRLNYTKNKLRQEQLAKEKAEREAAKAEKEAAKSKNKGGDKSANEVVIEEQSVEAKTENTAENVENK